MLKRKVIEEVRIDILAKEIYGNENNGSVEALLNANFGLAKQQGFVPVGDINIPEQPEEEPVATINPWE